MTQATKRRVGQRRWAELIRFLTQTMKTSGSERVNLSAAMRLADILTMREQCELAEPHLPIGSKAPRRRRNASARCHTRSE